MVSLDRDAPVAATEEAAARPNRVRLTKRIGAWIGERMPKGLYVRAILIIVTPMVILQSVLAFVFMERHWETVTQRLSAAVTRDIAALIDLYENYPFNDDYRQLRQIAFQDLNLNVAVLPLEPLPPTSQKPFFSILDRNLSAELTERIGRPFWIDTVGRSNIVEIRIQLADAIFRVFARRSQTYASNSHIFLVWMVGTSLVLVTVAVLFLRNQIRPILTLADAAENFGKGLPVPPGFRPRGAREVRRAARAFIEMRGRIERQMEQRTTMLAGVSHDLRTVLTRFRLQLALLGSSAETKELEGDVAEMEHMLEDYLEFAQGDAGEIASAANVHDILKALQSDLSRAGHTSSLSFEGNPMVEIKPNAFRRLIGNLILNAHRFGQTVAVSGKRDQRYLTIRIEDDGPGIRPEDRDAVFRPFFRLDDARNQDEGGTGLGLAIARDIARGHGGDIMLSDSNLGGLCATVRIPV
ncbi:MAG: two-component sensor histidine kinase [Rhodobiaceae bacterium]|nr:two-component sensor histidine kinase [Rhodobiaceae bacterium]